MAKKEVALAILHQGDRFLLQLRDNIPGIVYPGYWGFFGGHLEPGETPEVALRREVLEEIGYSISNFTSFKSYEHDDICRHFFSVPLAVGLDSLILQEGWDMDLWTPEEVAQGEKYSAKAGEVRPLGTPHQQVLLEFISGQKRSF